MAGLLEKDQVGKRELLADYITIADAASKPVLAMINKNRKLTNTYVRWQVDDYDDPNLTPQVDGKDVEEFENAAEDRAELATYCHYFRRTAKVSKLAEDVSNVAGASEGELARSITKKLEEIGRDIESVFCGDQDSQADTGAVGYQTRGLGEWITASTSTWAHSDQPAYHPPAASIITTTTGDLTEAHLQGVLGSVWDETGTTKQLDLVCGRTLKTAITGFTQQNTTTAAVALKTYNTPADQNKIISNITIYEGDFNTVRIHPSQFLARASAAVVSNQRGYVLDMSVLEMRWKQMPDSKRLEDRGGGPRALVEAVAALVVKNPLGLGKLAGTT